MVTYWVWKYNGDIDIVSKHYRGIRDWVEYLISRSSQRYIFINMFGWEFTQRVFILAA